MANQLAGDDVLMTALPWDPAWNRLDKWVLLFSLARLVHQPEIEAAADGCFQGHADADVLAQVAPAGHPGDDVEEEPAIGGQHVRQQLEHNRQPDNSVLLHSGK